MIKTERAPDVPGSVAILPVSYYTTWIAEVKSKFYVVARSALRVPSFREAVEYFRAKGYREDSDDLFTTMKVSPHATAGFPQLYILDPDRHIIEVNAAVLD